ncbi:hypothetical protein L359_06533 [Enterobacter hormaechei subsp. hoffmannii MGH 13]|nr:hypothetical protein L359_06533 [Enterobacter hormaechei subsp. hoffmannii MGH 13]
MVCWLLTRTSWVWGSGFLIAILMLMLGRSLCAGVPSWWVSAPVPFVARSLALCVWVSSLGSVCGFLALLCLSWPICCCCLRCAVSWGRSSFPLLPGRWIFVCPGGGAKWCCGMCRFLACSVRCVRVVGPLNPVFRLWLPVLGVNSLRFLAWEKVWVCLVSVCLVFAVGAASVVGFRVLFCAVCRLGRGFFGLVPVVCLVVLVFGRWVVVVFIGWRRACGLALALGAGSGAPWGCGFGGARLGCVLFLPSGFPWALWWGGLSLGLPNSLRFLALLPGVWLFGVGAFWAISGPWLWVACFRCWSSSLRLTWWRRLAFMATFVGVCVWVW